MLKELALNYFYTNQLLTYTFEEVCNNLRNFYEGFGFNCKTFDE